MEEHQSKTKAMAVNLDKPERWKQDTQASVDHYNKWFMKFAPRAFRDSRIQATKSVEKAILESNDMRDLSPDLLLSRPGILPTLRMSCCPPLAVDRLVGLACTSRSLVHRLERGNPPLRINAAKLRSDLRRLCRVISTLLDSNVCSWLKGKKSATNHERSRASRIIADRLLCHRVATDAARSARKIHQLSALSAYLDSNGYREIIAPGRRFLPASDPGSYMFFVSIPAAMGNDAFVPVDAVIQRMGSRPNDLPVLIRAESAGTFAESARRKSSHHRAIRALRMTCGEESCFVLLLAGYFGISYLGMQAAEGIDWVWQHRLTDLHALRV